MGLTMSRREGEDVRLEFSADMTAAELEELIREGITIAVNEINVNQRQARIWIRAPRSVLIMRAEARLRE